MGWCVAPPSVIERLRLVKQTTDLHTDQLAQAILAEFMRRGLLAKHITKMRKAYAKRLTAMQTALQNTCRKKRVDASVRRNVLVGRTAAGI